MNIIYTNSEDARFTLTNDEVKFVKDSIVKEILNPNHFDDVILKEDAKILYWIMKGNDFKSEVTVYHKFTLNRIKILLSVYAPPKTEHFIVLNRKPFVYFKNQFGAEQLGIAAPYNFASIKWFNDGNRDGVSGTKFSWIASDGELYTDAAYLFSSPTDEQILTLMTPQIQSKALELKLIELLA